MLRALVTCLLVACSSSSSSHVDGAPAGDALADGPNAAAMGLGAVCDGSHPCPTGAPMCVVLNAMATHGFCTLSCGTSTSGTMEPANGNQTCAAATPAPPDGTPACAIVGQKSGANYPWSCAIRCGMQGATNYGSCPGGLACLNNLCQ